MLVINLVLVVEAVVVENAATLDVDIEEEDDGDNALALRLEDEGGENCEFESISELVYGTELGGFSGFETTEAGCIGDMGWMLNGERFSSLLKRIFY